MNRLEGISVGNDALTNMTRVLEKLGPGLIVPEPNKYYVYVYKAKTPKIRYDQHPFVLVGDVFTWGFTGYNFHWDEIRRYTWKEVLSNIFEIKDEEVETMKSIPTALFKYT